MYEPQFFESNMPSFKLPYFTDAAILRSIEPNRLKTFLRRFESYLKLKDFAVPDDESFSDSLLQQLIGIFNLHDSQTPAEMIEALFHVSEVANDQGMEALLLVASKSGIELPDGDLSPADLAMHIWLYDPDLLRRANCERIVIHFQSFYCYMNKTLEAPEFAIPTDQVLRQIEDRINRHNRSRRRGGGAAVWMYEFDHEVAFLIRCGGSLKRDEIMDNDVCKASIRRPVGYDLVVYNIESGELRIRAELIGERRFYCRIFSEELFGDLEFFEHGETFDLSVIYELLEDIQSPGIVAEIVRITLVEIQEVLVGQKTLHVTLKSEGIFEALREHGKRLHPQGRLACAKFRVHLLDSIEVTVTIYSGNKIRFSRQVGLVSIDRWMLHHGIRIHQNDTLRISPPLPIRESSLLRARQVASHHRRRSTH
jgi:hypothetical protein